MIEEDRWAHLVALDEKLLKGGIILSEWVAFIVRDADTAFAGGAYLSTILTSASGIETYLRSEYSKTGRERLIELINQAEIYDDLKKDLHIIRKYRNKWVHVDDPWEDTELLEQPESIENALEEMAFFAIRLLRRTLYENPWI